MYGFLVTSFLFPAAALGIIFVMMMIMKTMMMMITITIETGPCLVTQADLELAILPLLRECCYMFVTSCLALVSGE